MILPPGTSSLPDPARSSNWGGFALVAYVPDPLQSLLNSLRASIPGIPLPPVHITVLPPRPLALPIEQACKRVEDITSDTPAFEAELSEVRYFAQSDFLYLDIAEGGNKIYDIHAKLNAGDLSHPEVYEFRPHLTLGGPVPQNLTQATQETTTSRWQELQCPRRILVDCLVCLWLDPARSDREWLKFHSFPLKLPENLGFLLHPEATVQRCSTGAPHPESFGQPGF